MRRSLVLLVLTFSLSLSGLALAQQQGDDDADGPRVIYKPVTNVEFGEKDVAGVIQGPSSQFVYEQLPPSFPPLMKTRTDFNPEMMQSVHRF